MKEILEKAIQKAIGGGWKAEFTAKNAVREWLNKSTVEMIDFKPVEYEFGGYKYKDIIFNHDFAKALWGDKSYSLTIHDVNTPSEYANSIMVQQPMWSYRLQQMVIADDPIEYLGKHI